MIPIPGGWRVRTQDGYHLDIRPLMRAYRLQEVPVGEPRDVARFWCYTSVLAAVLAANAWEVDPDTAPVGWIRRGGAR